MEYPSANIHEVHKISVERGTLSDKDELEVIKIRVYTKGTEFTLVTFATDKENPIQFELK